MIIDAYAHIMNSKYIDRLVEQGGKWTRGNAEWLSAQVQRKPHFVDVSKRLEHLERNGIDFQVVVPSHVWDCNIVPGDIATQLAYARTLNDSMASLMEESKGKLIGAGIIPIAGMEEGGRQEMERAINTLGLKAIFTLSNINGKPLDAFEPFLAQAAEMNIPLYFHPMDPASGASRSYEAEYRLIHDFGWPYETALILSRLVFSGIMERYPTLKVMAHHLGGGLIPFYMGRSAETHSVENPENFGVKRGAGIAEGGDPVPKRPFDYFKRFYWDTAVGGSAPAIRCSYEVFGADPMLFGTDYPMMFDDDYRLREYPKVIESLGLPEEDKEKIFAGNARRMLNLD